MNNNQVVQDNIDFIQTIINNRLITYEYSVDINNLTIKQGFNYLNILLKMKITKESYLFQNFIIEAITSRNFKQTFCRK